MPLLDSGEDRVYDAGPVMLWLYKKAITEATRRLLTSWPAALSLPVYAAILFPASVLASALGFVGGLLLWLVVAACWSSYLELISQAVLGARFRFDLEDFKRTFGARFSDVVSVMFAFWILSLLSGMLTLGAHAEAFSAMLGFAMAVFFNAVPELLYQGRTRSFALLVDSARFVMDHALAWFVPNLVFAGLALWASGGLYVTHPTELLILFGRFFSSPSGVLLVFLRLPWWTWPLALFALHYVMLFRGVLFRELASGAGNARLRAFQAKLRR